VPSVVLEQRTRAEGVDASAVEEEVRTRIAYGLPAADRHRAERLVDARRHLRAAARAFEEERFGDAARDLVGAAKAAPWLLTSPIWGPQLVLSTTKATVAAALPGQAGVRARKAIKGVRTRLGHNPIEPGRHSIGRD
jgi:hypothetical protein